MRGSCRCIGISGLCERGGCGSDTRGRPAHGNGSFLLIVLAFAFRLRVLVFLGFLRIQSGAELTTQCIVDVTPVQLLEVGDGGKCRAASNQIKKREEEAVSSEQLG